MKQYLITASITDSTGKQLNCASTTRFFPASLTQDQLKHEVIKVYQVIIQQHFLAYLTTSGNQLSFDYKEIKPNDYKCVAFAGDKCLPGDARLHYAIVSAYSAEEALDIYRKNDFVKRLGDKVKRVGVFDDVQLGLKPQTFEYHPNQACMLNPFNGKQSDELKAWADAKFPCLSKLVNKPVVRQIMSADHGEVFEIQNMSVATDGTFIVEIYELMKCFTKWIYHRRMDFTPPEVFRNSSSRRTL